MQFNFNVQYDSKAHEIARIDGNKIGGYNKLVNVRLKADGATSDGYHTFDELYHHRMMLFSIICNAFKDKAWKSWKHDDHTMYDDYFIVGITTDEGDYTYHYHKDHWNMFAVKERAFAPKWDGHKPEDITRLLSLVK